MVAYSLEPCTEPAGRKAELTCSLPSIRGEGTTQTIRSLPPPCLRSPQRAGRKAAWRPPGGGSLWGERWGGHPAAVPSPQQRAGRSWEPLCLFPHRSHFLLISIPCGGGGRNPVHLAGGTQAPRGHLVQQSAVFPASLTREASPWFPTASDLSPASSPCSKVTTEHKEKMPHHLPGEIHCSRL